MALGQDPAREARLADLRAELIKDFNLSQLGGAEGRGPVDPQRQQEVLDALQEWHAGGDTPSTTFLENLASRGGDSVGPTESLLDGSSRGDDGPGDAVGLGGTGADGDAGGLDLGEGMVDNPFAGYEAGYLPGSEGLLDLGEGLPDLSLGVDPGLGADPGLGVDPGAGHDFSGGLDLSSGMDPGASFESPGFDPGGFYPGGSGYDLAGGSLGDMGGLASAGGADPRGGLDRKSVV